MDAAQHCSKILAGARDPSPESTPKPKMNLQRPLQINGPILSGMGTTRRGLRKKVGAGGREHANARSGSSELSAPGCEVLCSQACELKNRLKAHQFEAQLLASSLQGGRRGLGGSREQREGWQPKSNYLGC